MKIIVSLIILLNFGLSLAQESDFHEFTNKQGQSIKAKIISVSKDWKTMEIQLAGSTRPKPAVTEINGLILDDQQFVKSWIQKTPAKADYNLRVEFEREVVKEDKEKGATEVYNTDHVLFTAKVKNLSSETLITPKVEYVVIYEEGVEVNFLETTGKWSDTPTSTTIEDRVLGIKGEAELPDISYNAEQSFSSKSLKISQVIAATSDIVAEDKLLGVAARVLTKQGVVIGEFFSKGLSESRYSWEVASTLPEELLSARELLAAKKGLGSKEVEIKLTKGVQPEDTPSSAGRDITFSATISPARSNPDGVIFAIGGSRIGLALMVSDEKIILVQTVAQIRKQVSTTIPLGNPEIEGKLTEDKLTLSIDGKVVATGESMGHFEKPPVEGLTIGLDGGKLSDSAVGEYTSPFAFEGTIRDARVILGARETKEPVDAPETE